VSATREYPTWEDADNDRGGDVEALRQRLQELEAKLHEANETIEAIRSGDVDAIVVQGQPGPQVYTLANDDRPYRRLIEQIGEGALTLTPDGVILYCNGRAAEMLRMPQERVIGGRLQQVIGLDDRRLVEAMLARGWGRHQITLNTPVGNTIPVHLTLTELERDGLRTLCAVLTDLTQQQQAESALQAAHARLLAETAERKRAEAMLQQAQKMEAVGQLTGGIAHDFNNMLTLVVGGLEMIERQLPGLPAGRPAARIGRGVEVAMKGADRAAATIRSLLAFARRHQLDPQPLGINDLLRGMLGLMHRSLGESVVIGTDLADDLWGVHADANQLENAILNVAINARDAMPKGGPLRFRTSNRSLAEPPLPDVAAGDYVVISITDGGIGMDQETLDKAFEPFFTTKAVGEGSGLGLSQVYGFARQSGGFATAASAPGKGTTIEICLPRLAAAEAPLAAGPRGFGEETAEARGETILVVENNDDVRRYCVEALRELGYEVLEATDATTALAMVECQPGIRLLFADIALGGAMNGRQLAEQALRRSARLKALLTTGAASSAAAAGPPDLDLQVLAKPFTFTELAVTVRRVLDGQLVGDRLG
jgi:PAS domain S-box-containing protein